MTQACPRWSGRRKPLMSCLREKKSGWEGKEDELLRLISLPNRTSERIRLAVAGKPPTALLTEHGWELTDAVEATVDADA